jgi:maleylacetate reductase
MQRFNQLPRERVYPDASALEAIRAEMDLRGARRVFIFSSATLARDDGPVAKLKDELGALCVGLNTGLSEHTPLEAVLAGAAAVRANGVDLIVAIGGGSVIDGAKAVKATMAAEIDSVDGFVPYSAASSNPMPMPAGGPSLIAIPTTLSAAEFSGTAGYTNPLSGLKEGVRAPHLAPSAVILDPDLALHTPIRLWTSSGIRAVDHAVETIFNLNAWASLRAKAATGLTMLADALRRAHADPTDRDARRDALQAVWLIGDCSPQLIMGASHGLGYLLGSLGGVPHGMTSCVLLPTVVAFNSETCPEPARQVADALRISDAAEGLRTLVAEFNLPTRISECVSDSAILDQIAAVALRHPVVRANPRPLADEATILLLLKTAW